MAEVYTEFYEMKEPESRTLQKIGLGPETEYNYFPAFEEETFQTTSLVSRG